uniref:Uncharacterized protein n=1 Tax=Oryza sativa subsp. japonica TaxID=39947 RepID=Q6K8H4_ORYSJ|nr:hypothetical protein [Oryza sativa Japonica Group]
MAQPAEELQVLVEAGVARELELVEELALAVELVIAAGATCGPAVDHRDTTLPPSPLSLPLAPPLDHVSPSDPPSLTLHLVIGALPYSSWGSCDWGIVGF